MNDCRGAAFRRGARQAACVAQLLVWNKYCIKKCVWKNAAFCARIIRIPNERQAAQRQVEMWRR